MKKILTLFAILMFMAGVASAQEVGIRWGDVSAGNVAIDAVFGMGNLGRTHANLSFGKGVGIDLIWDFLYRPIGIGESTFYWYAGAGPYAVIDDPFRLGVAGEVGLEYRFSNIPLSLSGDWRPEFEILDNTDFHAGGFGFNARYVF